MLRSALSYLNDISSGLSSSSSALSTNHESSFIGQTIEIGKTKVKVKKLIGEGGFAFVYIVQEISTGRYYALKRLIAADSETNKIIRQEIEFLKSVSGHKHVMNYLAATAIDKCHSPHDRNEYYVITELCTGGNLASILKQRGGKQFSPVFICQIMYQTCLAVRHLHTQQPPIIHRDLKIENLLIGDDGLIKLCDFGSATTVVHNVDYSWTASKRTAVEEEIMRFTTPMYRPPEVLDTWNNYTIGLPLDIWALGCVLYALCHARHPFEDGARLRILNAKYSFPSDTPPSYAIYQPLISSMLVIDPSQRLTIDSCLQQLTSIGDSFQCSLESPLIFDSSANKSAADVNSDSAKRKTAHISFQPPSSTPSSSSPIPSAPSPVLQHSDDVTVTPSPQVETLNNRSRDTSSASSLPSLASTTAAAATFSANHVLDTFKMSAESAFRNIVDVSKSVVQSIVGKECDISYITSRLLVMPYPTVAVDLTVPISNSLQDVRALLNAKYMNHYCVFNLSGRTYDLSNFNCVIDKDCNVGHCMSLPTIYTLCYSIYEYLHSDWDNVCVLHCLDGKTTCAVITASLLMFAKFFPTVEQGLSLFRSRRAECLITPSQSRYLNYFRSMVATPCPIIPHLKPVRLTSLIMCPVPLFTRNRDGCRPYVEVWQNGAMLVSTIRSYDQLSLYRTDDKKVTIPINRTVFGDVILYVYHARRVMGHFSSIRICELQFHTGFIDEESTSMRFPLAQLDGVSEPSRYGDSSFCLSVHVLVSDEVIDIANIDTALLPWHHDDRHHYLSPLSLFSTHEEMEQILEEFSSVSGVRDSPSDIIYKNNSAPSNQSKFHFISQNSTTSDTVEQDCCNIDSLVDLQISSAQSELACSHNHSNSDHHHQFLDLETQSQHITVIPSQSEENLLNDFFPTPSTNDSSTSRHNSELFNFRDETANVSNFDPFGLLDTSCNLQTNDWLKPQTTSEHMHQSLSSDNFSRDILSDGATRSSQHSCSSHDLSSLQSGAHSQQQYLHSNLTDLSTSADKISKSGASTAFADVKQTKAEDSADLFADILGSQGYSFSRPQKQLPKTIGEMKLDSTSKNLSPEQTKVLKWVDGRDNNIRALLCSMHEVVWPQCKWSGCGMAQLMSAADVKRVYRRACLAVHPDKQMGSEWETISNLIFVQLNFAYSEFEQNELN